MEHARRPAGGDQGRPEDRRKQREQLCRIPRAGDGRQRSIRRLRNRGGGARTCTALRRKRRRFAACLCKHFPGEREMHRRLPRMPGYAQLLLEHRRHWYRRLCLAEASVRSHAARAGGSPRRRSAIRVRQRDADADARVHRGGHVSRKGRGGARHGQLSVSRAYVRQGHGYADFRAGVLYAGGRADPVF